LDRFLEIAATKLMTTAKIRTAIDENSGINVAGLHSESSVPIQIRHQIYRIR